MTAWAEFWDEVSVLAVVGWVIGILGIITFFVKGWPTIRKFVAFIDALFSLPAFIARTDITLQAQDVKIEQIHHEVNYNNGSSVKDAVARVELGVKGLYDRVDAADKADAEIREELENTRPAPRKRTVKPKSVE